MATVRAWVEATVPRPGARRPSGVVPRPCARCGRSPTTRPGTRRSRRRAWSRPPGRWPTAASTCRRSWPGRSTRAPAVQPRPAQPARPQPVRAGAVRPRHRGAAPALAAAHRRQHGALVPAVQRAGGGIGPGLAGDPGRARRRRVGAHGPEGVDHLGARVGLGRVPGPHRSRRARSARASPTSWSTCASPGVDVRPLRHITGEVDFNEVFLDGVRSPTPSGSATWATGGGWPGPRCRASARWSRARARAGSTASAGRGPTLCSPWPGAPGAGPTRWCASGWWGCGPRSASGAGPTHRVRAGLGRAGPRDPESSVGKVHQGDLNQRIQLAACDLLGPGAAAWSGDRLPAEVKGMLRSRANTIEGGTTEVNKNVIGERVLGLPREPDPWRDGARGRTCRARDRRVRDLRRRCAGRSGRLAGVRPARRRATPWTPRCSPGSSGRGRSSTPTPRCG